MKHNHVVIMAGGVGSRFWPLSTPEYPKQFIDILGVGRTLIQLTYDRFRGIAEPQNVWVVTNAKYVNEVRKQLPDVPVDHILSEPAARNTAPCIAWACWCILKKDSQANVVVTPSDAIVMDTTEFQRVISESLAYTAINNAIVTVGIQPTRPETGYGYVQLGGHVNREIYMVDAFKEKPNLEIAKGYLQSGNYLWNAGIFVWNIHTIVNAITKYKPNIAADMDKIVETGDVQNIFPECEKISIDFAVMEPAAADGRVFTHPASFGWSDLGNWQSLHEKLQKDVNNNGKVGNVSFIECKDCVVHAEDAKTVVLQGLEGYIVSEKNGNILVCKRSQEQRIKDWNQ